MSKTILIVEDYDDVRFMLRYALEMDGHRVVEATNGYDAIEVANAEHPDLILMDLHLPRLNGFATTRFMRHNKDLCDIPIIALSSYDPSLHRNVALAAGCIHYLKKPIDFNQLNDLISSSLQEKSR